MWINAPSGAFASAYSLNRKPEKTVATLTGLGSASHVDTLRHMRAFVHESLRHPDQIVRECALSLVANCPERRWVAEVAACHGYVRDAIRYVRDPEEFELVQSPEKTLQYRQGDCDDKATLLAALLKSLAHPTRFVAIAVGSPSAPFSHVLCESKVGDGWWSLETILPVPMGWYPPDATRRYVLEV